MASPTTSPLSPHHDHHLQQLWQSKMQRTQNQSKNSCLHNDHVAICTHSQEFTQPRSCAQHKEQNTCTNIGQAFGNIRPQRVIDKMHEIEIGRRSLRKLEYSCASMYVVKVNDWKI
jgi:hypothetical protein